MRRAGEHGFLGSLSFGLGDVALGGFALVAEAAMECHWGHEATVASEQHGKHQSKKNKTAR